MTVAGTHEMAVGTTPGASATGKLRIYASSVDGLWHQVDESNVDTVLSGTPGATGPTGPAGAGVPADVTAHGNLGSTETFDYDTGDQPDHSGTLNAACTFTFSNPAASGKVSLLTLHLDVDSGGPWAVTLPASILNQAEAEAFLSAIPALGEAIVPFVSIDGGTSWAAILDSSDLDSILAASSGQDIADALTGAAAPTAGNVFATMADVGGGGGSLTSFDAMLSGDVTMTTANTYYDGPNSGSLAAGTWMVWYKVLVTGGTSATGIEAAAKLWDGSTVYDESEQATPVNAIVAGFPLEVVGFAVITLGSSTTIKVSAVSTHNSATMSRDEQTGLGAASHTATRISGIKIA